MRIRQQGLRLERGPFVLNALFDPAAAAAERPPRIGVVSAKRLLGDAVHRNRARRVFKEIFRLHPDTWQPGWDVVIVPRRSFFDKEFAALEKYYEEQSARLQRLHQQPPRRESPPPVSATPPVS
jgi:ribonuclease P protein component